MKMKLQDNLYTILSQQETEGLATFQLSIHPEWPIYKAHFPGQNRDVTLRKAKNVKYLAIISPEEVSELTVSFTKIETLPDGSLKVQAQVFNGETIFTKMSATFA